MGTGRDDFSADTIRKAASRVGYRCSFPGCKNSTVGASMEDSEKVSTTGVAAHICAAAKGGPRYDEKMTVEERKGIENCIWLCQTHSKLIDTDVTTYTVDILRGFKKEAEERAARALAEGDFFDGYYEANENNLIALEQLFEDMVDNGQYEQLKILLDQYSVKISEQFEEFIYRYRIIYDTYCDRKKLSSDLEKYTTLPCKTGSERLAGLFIAFAMPEELKKIIEFCNDNTAIKEYSQLLIDGKLYKKLFREINDKSILTVPEEIYQIVLRYRLSIACSKRILGIFDDSEKMYTPCIEEFYYKVLSCAYNLANLQVYENLPSAKLVEDNNFRFIIENIGSLKNLDIALQEYIWEQLLTAVVDYHVMFNELYCQCPNVIKRSSLIQKTALMHEILHTPNEIEPEKLLEYCQENENYGLVCMYLTKIDCKKADCFLDDHGFLYKKSTEFLRLKISLNCVQTEPEIRAFLEKYREIYADSFQYHCLLAQYSEPHEPDNIEVTWIKGNMEGLNIKNLDEYMRAMRVNQCWEAILKVYNDNTNLPCEYIFRIAIYLLESQKKEYVKDSISINMGIIKRGYLCKGLYYYLGIAQAYLGKLEAAKVSFKNEFEIYETSDALRRMLSLRYETNEFVDDKYLARLKESNDARDQNIVAATYMKLQRYGEAKKYFLRSLLISDHDYGSLTGLWQISLRQPVLEIDSIQENAVCTLIGNEKTVRLAIHPADILEGIERPRNVGEIYHFAIDDPRISELLYHEIGDEVQWDGETFLVKEIESIDNAISDLFFSEIIKKETTIKIQSDNAQNMVNQLADTLKSTHNTLEGKIIEYNNQEVRLPLSGFAKITGESMLRSLEFLIYENKATIINNLNSCESLDVSQLYILGYDAIVLLVHMGMETSDFNSTKIACSYQVKNQLLNDIGEEFADISDKSHKATMFYDEGKLAIVEKTPSAKRERHEFVSRLKTFVNNLKIIENKTEFIPSEGELGEAFEELYFGENLICESSTLGVVQNTDNAVLVTDDQFVYQTANAERIPNIGIIGFLLNAKYRWDDLLEISKNLKKLNFNNYLPISLYKRIVDLLLEDREKIQDGSAKIIEWLTYNTDGEECSHHEEIIIELFKEVGSGNMDYLNPGHILTEITAKALEKKSPGMIQKVVKEILLEMQILENDSLE